MEKRERTMMKMMMGISFNNEEEKKYIQIESSNTGETKINPLKTSPEYTWAGSMGNACYNKIKSSSTG